MKREPHFASMIEDRGVLRFLTCGSVDDGKSTLIGRLLYDTKTLLADTLATLWRTSEKRGLAAPDLSLLTDGLTAEREQGITIDVAYRYFATARRKFIIADAPGHEQYTRNMVTAASAADVAVLLVDARKGLLPQTKRHATIAALLGIRQLILAVNKMDLVDFDEAAFLAIEAEFRAWLGRHPEVSADVRAVPLSALDGDMVVDRGTRLDWYSGSTVVELLENAPCTQLDVDAPLRFPVQWVCRPAGDARGKTGRGYCGRVEAGHIEVGDGVTVLPGGLRSRVTHIALGDVSLPAAHAGQSVTVSLADERDISRGDMLVRANDSVAPRTRFGATLCWLAADALAPARSYLLRQTTRTVKARLGSVDGKLDIHTLAWSATHDAAVGLNDIARVQLKTQQPLVVDAYRDRRATGSFILIDETSNNTVAAGVFD